PLQFPDHRLQDIRYEPLGESGDEGPEERLAIVLGGGRPITVHQLLDRRAFSIDAGDLGEHVAADQIADESKEKYDRGDGPDDRRRERVEKDGNKAETAHGLGDDGFSGLV